MDMRELESELKSRNVEGPGREMESAGRVLPALT